MAAARKKILLVDDDEPLREALAGQLQLHEEFETVELGSGTDALSLLETETFDGILLDIAMPDMDGRDVCRVLRRKGIHTPVILLTGLEGEADTILGLDKVVPH